MRTIEIAGKEWKMAYNLRSLFMYEEIAGHPYTGEKLVDSYLLMFAMLMANNEEFSMEFDAFINECDQNPAIAETFGAVMKAENDRLAAYHDKKKAESR